ncbi:MAG TPA: hypothetical protein VF187_08065 [Gemmatimonadales bacterium]
MEQHWQARAIRIDHAARLVHLFRLLTTETVPPPPVPVREQITGSGQGPATTPEAAGKPLDLARIGTLLERIAGFQRVLQGLRGSAAPAGSPSPPSADQQPDVDSGGAVDALSRAQQLLAALSPEQKERLQQIAAGLFGAADDPSRHEGSGENASPSDAES